MIDVNTAEFRIIKGKGVLRSMAIGSCVTVCVYYHKEKIGGLAHIMLAGYAPDEKPGDKMRYAGNMIDEMLKEMRKAGADINEIELCVAGGANVLKRPDDTTAKNNIDFVVDILRDKGLKIAAESLGGTMRRSVLFDVGAGSVFCAVGDEEPRLLWAAERKTMQTWINELEQAKAQSAKALEALAAGEKRLKTALQRSNVTVFNQDKELRYTWAYNPSPKLRPELIIGKRDEDLVSREDAELLTEIKRRVLDKGISQKKLIRFTIDQKESFYDLMLEPIRDEDGNISGIIGVSLDVTERKGIEKALVESEEKFRTMFESMVEGVALHELVYDNAGRAVDYRIIDVNPAYKRHTGINPKHVIGKTSTCAYGTPEPPYFEIYERVARTGVAHVFEMYFPPMEKHFLISVFSPKVGQFVTVFEDITERKNTDAALRESEEKFRLAMEATKDALWDWNIETDQVYRNPSYATMLGYRPDELTPDQSEWEKRIHPDDKQRLFDLYESYLKGKIDKIEIEYRLRTKSGDYIWILGRGKVVQYNESGSPVRMVGTNVDITERKNAEKELENVFNLSSDMICIASPDGKFAKINPAWQKSLGYEIDEMFKLGWANLIHPDDREKTAKGMERQLRGGSTANFTNRYRCKDGTYKTFEWKATSSEEGLLYASARDITEREKKEENLKEKLSLNSILLDNLPCIALILKKGTREIVVCNETARKFGVVEGKTCYETCAGRDDNCPWCLAPKVWSDNVPRRSKVEYKGKYYESVWVPFSQDLYVHYIFDITDCVKPDKDFKKHDKETEWRPL